VEVGTGTRDASMDEWLEVCGFRFLLCFQKSPMIDCHTDLYDKKFSFSIVLPPILLPLLEKFPSLIYSIIGNRESRRN